MPEEKGIYPKTKVIEQLLYFAELKGLNKEEALKNINYWAPKLKIDEYLYMPAEKLSKGNQQKVQFMTAILHNPDLLILDEPFSGLDPVNTDLIKNIIIELVKKGKYVIMSAHQMITIEEFCSDILILDKGKTVLKGNLEDIKNSYPANRLIIETANDLQKYLNTFKLELEYQNNNKYTIKISDENIAQKLLNKLVQDNIFITKFEIQKPTLNDIFIECVGK